MSADLFGYADQNDHSIFLVEFFDGVAGTGNLLGSQTLDSRDGDPGSWSMSFTAGTLPNFQSISDNLPINTASIVFSMTANRTAGNDNDGYADNLSFILTYDHAGATCQLYAVHDDGLNDSQLFTVNPDTLEVNALGEIYENHDIEALDIHPQTGELFAASGDNTPNKGYLYQVNKANGQLTNIGPTGCKEVDALSFHPNGTLWGWAQDCGLLTIDTGTGKATVILPHNQVEVEDITWNTDGTILYGVENLHGGHHPDSHGEDEDNSAKDRDFDQGVKLWSYDYPSGAINSVCDDLTQSQREIEALETLPDNNLLFGFHGSDGILNAGVVDVQNCQLLAQETLPTVPYNDVEGIAWSTCNTQCPVEEAELVAKFEWTEGGYVFEKPEGNDDFVTITGNAVSGTWNSEIPMSHIILKGGTNTGTINIPDQNSGEFSNTVIPVNGGGNIPAISNIQFFGCPIEGDDSNNPNVGKEIMKPVPGTPGGFAVGGIDNT